MRYTRQAGVSETEIDDGVFLVEPKSQEIYFLDAISRGLWRLLGEASSLADLQGVVRQAFPDQAPAEIDRDVAAVIVEMSERGLVVSVP
ncbi:MAG: PqqD family protein [Rhodospirillales bacterium]